MDHEITTIGIAVTGTSAQSDGTVYVCDNSVYRILFDFDEEWAAEPVKTVRFKWGSESSTEMFEGNEIELPLISGVQRIEVSLSAGKLHTKKPAIILCRESILGGGGTPDDTQGEDPDGEVGGLTTIVVTVADKIAMSDGTTYVCDNDHNYVIRFELDAEWDTEPVKTARFRYGSKYFDKVFTGDEVYVPRISGVYRFEVGVYAGNLRASTAAVITCRKSVLGSSGTQEEPQPDVYGQIMTMLGEMFALYGPDNVAKTIRIGLQEAKESGMFDGPKGEKGDPGYTPVKGKDYDDGKDGVTPDFKIGTVETLPEGSNATASVTGTAEKPLLNIGIPQGSKGDPFVYSDFTEEQLEALQGPKGDPGYTPKKGVDYFDGKNGDPGYTPVKGKDYNDGKDGVTPDFKIGTVETLPEGSNATASVTGTAEKPLLNIGIPQGSKGNPGAPGANATINGVNALSVVAQNGVKATQDGTTLTIELEEELDPNWLTGVIPPEKGGTGVTSLEELANMLNIGSSGGVQTATGTYQGTGIYDRANKNILKLPFSPKFLWIQATNNTTMVKFSQMGCYAFALNSSDYIQGGYFARTVRSGTGGGVTNDLKPYSKFMDEERTEVRWYSETSADLQMNASGITYTWLAIG